MDPAIATVVAATIAALGMILNTWVTFQQRGKINETHKQVSENHHSNENPTVLDRIDDVAQSVNRLEDKVDAHGMRFDLHVLHSDSLEKRLVHVEDRVA